MATNRSSRMDAQDAYFLSNQLQTVDATKYYNLIPGVVGRSIIPAIPGISPNAPVYKWKTTKLQGVARKGRGRSKGAPTVSVVKIEEIASINTYEDVASWTIDEVRAAREANEDLPQETLMAAVAAIEQKIDAVLAIGDSLTGTLGLTNNTSVLSTTAGAKTGGGTSWLSTTATTDEILLDIVTALEAQSLALKQAQTPNDSMPYFDQFALYLPTKHFTRLMVKRLGSTNEVTALGYIRKNFEMIKSIRPWWRLDTADNGNPMAVMAPALDTGALNPMAGGAILPLDFEQLPEQYDGRTVSVPCAGKCGGVVIRYPVAFRYIKSL